jgi:hypothetical protein
MVVMRPGVFGPGRPLTIIPFAQYAVVRALPMKLSHRLLSFRSVLLSYDHYMATKLPFSNILLNYSKPSLKLSNSLLNSMDLPVII